jgi:transcriptional regulator with XRE-family HTH domain
VREARERKNLSVRELARYLGFSPSFVSQVELGKTMPSVGSLYSFANALDISVDNLFADTKVKNNRKPNGAADDTSPLLNAEARKMISLANGVRWERLSPTNDRDVEFRLVCYQPGAESYKPDALIRRRGKEYAYVISGRFGITLGTEEFDLKAGDSISFDARVPHRVWAIGNARAQALWVVRRP